MYKSTGAMESSHLAATPVADSRAPTVAPSNPSLSEQEHEHDPEKASVEDAPREKDEITTEQGSSQPAIAQTRTAENEPIENEKANELHPQATAATTSGDAVVPVPTREDGSEYPTGMKLGLINLALCLAVFLMALGEFQLTACLFLRTRLIPVIDNSIIATAIPKITDQFHSLGDVGWYGSGQ